MFWRVTQINTSEKFQILKQLHYTNFQNTVVAKKEKESSHETLTESIIYKFKTVTYKVSNFIFKSYL